MHASFRQSPQGHGKIESFPGIHDDLQLLKIERKFTVFEIHPRGGADIHFGEVESGNPHGGSFCISSSLDAN
ncbi:hypothetical protein SDC9_190428 [bioreactor metagenome]|uniref:Uncharacterized protein n=1 Tax=bioreactor metagenome TaxID=1076179 RepID=A0A645HVJ3_9ZZZZ